MTAPDVDIILPVHNEAAAIEATLRELFAEIGARLTVRLIACEDGSTDDSVAVIRRLAAHYPIELLTSTTRKGYSRAVIDGMRAARAPYALIIDSDGQCDPHDFWAFWHVRQEVDIVMGYRKPRRDSRLRLVLSATFRAVFQLLFRTPVHDPSCPFVLVSREALAGLVPELGAFEHGLWWEFTARAFHRRLRVREVRVHHRIRASGQTQVYRLRALPRIGLSHVRALLALWRETRA